MSARHLGVRLALVLATVLGGAAGGLIAASLPRAAAAADWAQVHSDITADPAVLFGKLSNGMRYAIMQNATPKGAVSLRFFIAAGSLQESDAQQGLAHFLEHMAFRGSRHVPENEVWPGLQRLGMSGFADANAGTNFTHTVYQFDLPLADDKTVDNGLLRMRDTASELTLAQRAMDDERGVILSEERLRATPGYRRFKQWLGQTFPGNIANSRITIGQTDIIKQAPVSLIRDFYHAYYRPERATLIVVGAIDPKVMEKKIVDRFSDWKPVGPAGGDPQQAKLVARGPEIGLFVEPGAESSLDLTWVTAAEPDTKARKRANLVKLIGFSILNYRLQDLANGPQHPFAGTSPGLENLLGTALVWSIGLVTRPQDWRTALDAAVTAVRRIDEFGVTADEVARVTNALRAELQAAVAKAATRPSRAVADQLAQTVDNGTVFNSPADRLSMAEEVFKDLTTEQVNAGLRSLMRGHGPLILLSSPTPVEGGKPAVVAALAAAEKAPLTAAKAEAAVAWPYAKFGPAGQVVDRKTIADLQTTFVRYANGVRLTVKPTKFAADEIVVDVRIGNGRVGLPPDRASPRWASDGGLVLGGLKAISFDNITRALAGKIVGLDVGIADDALTLRGRTRPADLATQLQLFAAYVSAPGWRAGAIDRVRTDQADRLMKASASPEGVFYRDVFGLLRGGDRRWFSPTLAEVEALRPQDLKTLLEAPLASGPIEVVVVGDVAVDTAVQAVAATFGALPHRSEPAAPSPAATAVRFPAGTAKPIELLHKGRADQGYVAVAWPTADGFDPQSVENLEVLKSVFLTRLTDQIRNRDAATYTPRVESENSRVFPGYGYLLAATELPAAKMPLFFTVTDSIAADLRAHAVSADELERARKPLVEKRIAQLQKNGVWAYDLAGAQTNPHRLAFIRDSVADIKRVTAADVQGAAQKYLIAAKAWQAEVRPEPASAR